MQRFGFVVFAAFLAPALAAAQTVTTPTVTSPVGQQTGIGLNNGTTLSTGIGLGNGSTQTGNGVSTTPAKPLNGQNVGTVTLHEPEKPTVLAVPKLGQVTLQRYDLRAETFATPRGASLMRNLVDPSKIEQHQAEVPPPPAPIDDRQP